MSLSHCIKVTDLKNGNLKIEAVDDECREEISEFFTSRPDCVNPYDATWCELFEDYRANGDLTPLSRDDFALCDCLYILSDDVDYADNGDLEHVGRVWWFPNHQVQDPIEDLINGKPVIMTLAEDE